MIQKNRLIDTFITLVKIDSPSTKEKELATFLTAKLKAMDASIKMDEHGNLFARFFGEGKPFMLNCHMDTVEPGRNIKPIVKKHTIESDGKTILGGDAKAGLAIILEILTSLNEKRFIHRPIEVVLTVEEELGLLGAKKIDMNDLTAKEGLSLDGSKDIQNVTISAPGYSRVDVTITGRASHAGAQPEKGISAIKIASDIISHLHLGMIDEETTANIGLISGGSARNTIPGLVEFKGEIRSRDSKKLEAQTKHFNATIKKIAAQYPEATIDTRIIKEFNPYSVSPKNGFITFLQKEYNNMGLIVNFDHAGGGSDANIFQQNGFDVFAVGMGDYEAHTTREFVIIHEMVTAAKVCEQLVTSNRIG